MALDFSNIHSLKKIKKPKKDKQENFPFERVKSFPVNIPENVSIYPFFRKGFSLEEVVFFDTETTGLSHGAGNIVFLAGVGFFEGGKFIVKQYFVSNPGIEFKLIETLIELFSKRRIVISYNGKCFDIPIIKTRCAINGINEPDIEQIDLYHISRFIWKEKLPGFRLVDVERRVLGFERKNDLPGSMAPFAYREFLLRGKRELLEKVFEHNLRDVYSLLELYLKISDKKDKDILFATARKHYKNKEYKLSLDVLRTLVSLDISSETKKSAYFLAAMCLKKMGDFDKAITLWEMVGDIESYVELAKFYEHKEKDYGKALKYTELALNKADPAFSLFKELIKRRNRLTNKLGFFNL